MCIGVHDIFSFWGQSAKAEKLRHLILMYGKMGYKYFDLNIEVADK